MVVIYDVLRPYLCICLDTLKRTVEASIRYRASSCQD